MKGRNRLMLAAIVLLFSASALASSIADPGGIIRKGINYSTFAVIGENFSITFKGEPLAFPFNPFNFTDSFCPIMDATLGDATVSGPDCQFLNESGQTINAVSQFFSASPGDFEDAGGLTCFNQISDAPCSTDGGNALLFFGLGIPTAEEYSSAILGSDTNTDPFFNLLNFGYGTNTDLAEISNFTASVPEPASMGLMLSSLFGLGLVLKRKMGARAR